MTDAELVSKHRTPRRPLDDRRRHEVAHHLSHVVASCPGVSVGEAVEQLRRWVPVQAAFAVSVLREMEHRGTVQRRAWGYRHCLFPSHLDVEDWWQQVAALRDDALRILYAVVQGGAWTLPDLCRELQERHEWGASTTRARIQRLRSASLVAIGRPGRHHAALQARPLHPMAQEALQEPYPKQPSVLGRLGNAI